MKPRAIGTVLADVWTSIPNVHLRVLEAEHGRREFQICKCGMSGHCRPEAFAIVEAHNLPIVAAAITSAEGK